MENTGGALANFNAMLKINTSRVTDEIIEYIIKTIDTGHIPYVNDGLDIPFYNIRNKMIELKLSPHYVLIMSQEFAENSFFKEDLIEFIKSGLPWVLIQNCLDACNDVYVYCDIEIPAELNTVERLQGLSNCEIYGFILRSLTDNHLTQHILAHYQHIDDKETTVMWMILNRFSRLENLQITTFYAKMYIELAKYKSLTMDTTYYEIPHNISTPQRALWEETGDEFVLSLKTEDVMNYFTKMIQKQKMGPDKKGMETIISLFNCFHLFSRFEQTFFAKVVKEFVDEADFFSAVVKSDNTAAINIACNFFCMGTLIQKYYKDVTYTPNAAIALMYHYPELKNLFLFKFLVNAGFISKIYPGIRAEEITQIMFDFVFGNVYDTMKQFI